MHARTHARMHTHTHTLLVTLGLCQTQWSFSGDGSFVTVTPGMEGSGGNSSFWSTSADSWGGGGWGVGGGSDTQYNCVTCTQLTHEECQHSHNHTQSGQ